ncbi:MAG: P-loop NTPase [Planctomycetia bacterium]|nr:P-loop NTPase [Planctomycetia bacterium]
MVISKSCWATMMHDQADELRQLVRERSNSGAPSGPTVPLVVVSGGKGGVGTTTIAANLAVALARQGRRAVFVDADLDHGGNANLCQHPQIGSVVDVLNGKHTVYEVLQRGPSSIQVLSGAWASGELTDCSAAAQRRFIAELKALAPHAEVVVVDAGSSRNHFVRRLWHAASAVLVVTTTDSVSIMDCYAAIKVLLAGDASLPIQTLVNFAANAQLAGDVQSRIATACRRFLGLRAAGGGHVPRCETGGSAAEPVLIYPARSESARALDRIADTFWAQLQFAAVRNQATRQQAALPA